MNLAILNPTVNTTVLEISTPLPMETTFGIAVFEIKRCTWYGTNSVAGCPLASRDERPFKKIVLNA